jgi:hypothetical protein
MRQADEETLRKYVLRAIADDYEDFEIVLRSVNSWARKHGVVPDRQQIQEALEELINEGYAQSYILSSGPPATAEPVPYSPELIDSLWFYITPKGKLRAQHLREEWAADLLDE